MSSLDYEYEEGVELEEGEELTWDPDAKYTKAQLEELADQLLRADAKRELCRKCLEADPENPENLPYGTETGTVIPKPMYDDIGDMVFDEEGHLLYVEHEEVACEQGHLWFKGEGAKRDIRRKDPILFKSHLDNRRKREIYTEVGTPDPSIVSGLYNRTHPQGRKVNTGEQRKKSGASFYR